MNNEIYLKEQAPRPFTQEENLEYLKRYYNGDKIAKEMIIKHNIYLVINRVLTRFQNTPYDENDLVSIGLEALIKSIDTYQISKNFAFSTYVTRCIDNEILMFLRKNKKFLNIDSMEKPIKSTENNDEIELKDTILDEDSDIIIDYEEKELYLIVREIIENLPTDEKDIISPQFGLIGYGTLTQNEIADKLNVSQSKISRSTSVILQKIKIKLKAKGIY